MVVAATRACRTQGLAMRRGDRQASSEMSAVQGGVNCLTVSRSMTLSCGKVVCHFERYGSRSNAEDLLGKERQKAVRPGAEIDQRRGKLQNRGRGTTEKDR